MVDTRRINAIKNWLEQNFKNLENKEKNIKRLLILTGPSGSGKSTVIRVLKR